MSVNLNVYSVFNEFNATEVVEQYPFFELAHLIKAVEQPSIQNNHQAAILLQNNLWFQYLVTVNKQVLKTKKIPVSPIDESEKQSYSNSIIADKKEETNLIAEATAESATVTEYNNIEAANVATEIQAETNIDAEISTETILEIKDEEQAIIYSSIESETKIGEDTKIESMENVALTQNVAETLTVADISEPLITSIADEKESDVSEEKLQILGSETGDSIVGQEKAINEVLETPLEDNDTQTKDNGFAGLKNTQSLKSILGDIKSGKQETDATNNTPIDIEPYHTIDYFASQGIKVSNISNVDRLTVQLKSFTQWLKTMKKVEALSTKIDTIEELNVHKNVVSLAEDSIKNSEILTENMVDVLVQQGKTNAAIKLLEKLSLQEPTKSVYFATQIKNLKNS